MHGGALRAPAPAPARDPRHRRDGAARRARRLRGGALHPAAAGRRRQGHRALDVPAPGAADLSRHPRPAQPGVHGRAGAGLARDLVRPRSGGGLLRSDRARCGACRPHARRYRPPGGRAAADHRRRRSGGREAQAGDGVPARCDGVRDHELLQRRLPPRRVGGRGSRGTAPVARPPPGGGGRGGARRPHPAQQSRRDRGDGARTHPAVSRGRGEHPAPEPAGRQSCRAPRPARAGARSPRSGATPANAGRIDAPSPTPDNRRPKIGHRSNRDAPAGLSHHGSTRGRGVPRSRPGCGEKGRAVRFVRGCQGSHRSLST